MKNWINNISKEKLQRFLFLGVLVLVFAVFLISLVASSSSEAPSPVDPDKPTPTDPVDDPKEEKPTEPTIEILKAPCDLESFNIIRKYYSLEDEASEQEISVIKFGSKYFLSRGISIKSEDDLEFSVVASLSGTVKEVTDSAVYGKTVIIDHGDEVLTEYISLGTVAVKVGDTVKQGTVIGTSGTNEYDIDASNHVHFKVSVKGVYYDPEANLGKTVNQIK